MSSRFLRSLLATSLLGAALPLAAQTAPAPAPTAAAAEVPVKLEAFTVTGSNVKRLEVEKVLPVTIFDTAAMEVRDPGQPSDMITALPQVTGCRATRPRPWARRPAATTRASPCAAFPPATPWCC